MVELADALRRLRAALGEARFALGVDGSADATEVRDELAGQIDDYLLPRLDRIDAPVLVVLGGSTGSGKSTVTNSLVGANVSLAGVLRPSTRTPVLVSRPEDHAWFRNGGVLPELARSTGERPTGSGLHLMTSDRLPRGLALLDAPDIDSVEVANHELAASLLGAADVWLFVTTAGRYADAVPWEYLQRARDRAMALALVVNRIPPGAEQEVVAHLSEMLATRGLGETQVFAVAESPADSLVDGRLSDGAIVDIRRWLSGLVADEATRDALVRSTLQGAVASIPARVEAVIAALVSQRQAADELRAASRRHHEQALAGIDDELASGTLLRSEVLDRWREHVGTGAFMDRIQQGVGRVRSRLKALATRSPAAADAAPEQIGSNLDVLVRTAADRAALETVTAWERLPGGRVALGEVGRGIDRASVDLTDRMDRQFQEWQAAVFDLVRDRSGNKVVVAKTLSLGINGIGVALMIAVFSHTGGLSGAEAGVAAGTAAVSQTVLTAIFGDQAVRDLVRRARDDLTLRLVGEFETERQRFERLLDPVPGPADIDLLTKATAQLPASDAGP